ncbi:tumor necrosis factor receptor superfamily member 13B isoform X2 [Oncorhynchus tshawytscha]|uniref:tumor necrosis factor receptor superfamily member 13B isoform X2 n=1 Tax=Oncorhynchus tshawytscha TaxID=74940 RepID=UPI000D09B012|nr:tumor necrosis factor receptor superfamily member 13B isoform X2 [Oncorhynchus tshawytscha]
MGLGCSEGYFWDRLVRKCLTCQMVCQQPNRHLRCIEYCVSLGCKAVPGQYYDRLLKMCLRCAAVCGSHPSECSHQCQTQQSALNGILRPVDGNAFQNHTIRGGYLPRGLPYSTILVYSLLSLCLTLLLLTLSVALLVLLRRPPRPGATQNSHTQGHEGQKGQEPNQNTQSSKDCPMDPSLLQINSVTRSRSSSPTETCVCVHCFPDLGVPGKGEKQQRPPLTLYQQAVPQDLHSPTRAPQCGSSQRIICSPSQPSF